nr:uncharacterized protein LOC120096591 isoform X2 [Rattus norvegicus]
MKRRPTKTSEVMHGIAMQEHPFTVEWTHLRSAEMGKTRENETVLKQFERFEIVFMLRGPRKLQKSFSIQDFFFFLEIGKFYKMQPIKSPHLELKRKSPSRSISFFLEDFFNEAGKISLRRKRRLLAFQERSSPSGETFLPAASPLKVKRKAQPSSLVKGRGFNVSQPVQYLAKRLRTDHRSGPLCSDVI